MSTVTQAKAVEPRSIGRFIQPAIYVIVLILFALIPVFVGHSPYMLDLVIMMIINSVLAMVFILLLEMASFSWRQ